MSQTRSAFLPLGVQVGKMRTLVRSRHFALLYKLADLARKGPATEPPPQSAAWISRARPWPVTGKRHERSGAPSAGAHPGPEAVETGAVDTPHEWEQHRRAPWDCWLCRHPSLLPCPGAPGSGAGAMPEAAAVAAADAPTSPEANEPQVFNNFYRLLSKQINPRFKTAKT